MNRHQVLTGAVNGGDNCCAVGGVDGVPFIAYAAGCNIVILSSDFQRVQVIPGVKHDNVQINCLDCSADFGKIATSYGKKICIFEPTPLLDQTSSHRLDYCWLQTASFTTDCPIHVLSWNPDGTQVLTGGDSIQLWVLSRPQSEEEEEVTFHLGKDQHPPSNTDESAPEEDKTPTWDCLWKCKTSSTVNFLKFSSDGTLFASAGKNDRLVKIWYENRKVNFFSVGSGATMGGDLSYTFVYVAHPRAVTSLSWRRTSKYMPRHSVANMLVTSCRDNICRIWLQTLLPEDGLVNLQQIEALAPHQAPNAQTQRHRHRILQRLKHMKSFSQYKRRQATQMVEDPKEVIPSLPSTYSVHDFHSFGFHGSGVAPGVHFHLAASINAATDIPLVPSISGEGSTQFVLHWLNNKETVFSQATEQLLKHLSHKSHLQQQHQQEAQSPDSTSPSQDDTQSEASLFLNIRKEGESEESTRQTISAVSSSLSMAQDQAGQTQPQSQQSPPPLVDALDRKIDSLLRDWSKKPDLLFSIHPVDGSFLVWLVEYLDEVSPGSYRQAQVSFCSRLPGAFPLGDAATMAEQLYLYSPHGGIALRMALLQDSLLHNQQESPQQSESHVSKLEAPISASCALLGSLVAASATSSNTRENPEASSPVLCMISRHTNGSLNLWHLTFGDQSNYTQVLSVSHSSRVCGHRFRINDITCHPVLPLLLTTSHHNLLCDPSDEHNHENQHQNDEEHESLGFCSELILWKVDPVGPLSKSGGVIELARINSPKISAFSNVAWIPTLLPSTTLGSISNSTSACFVASDGQHLRIYQAVIDARTVLAEVSAAARKNKQDDMSMSSSTSSPMGYQHSSLQETFRIVSLQSTARPGCILELEAIEDACHDWHNTQFLHVFQEQMVLGKRLDHYGTSQGQNRTSSTGGGLVEPGLEAVVDLRRSTFFEEPFYLVVLEKTEDSQILLHMWKVLLASNPDAEHGHPGLEASSVNYVPDSNLVQESDHSNQSSRSNTPEPQSHPLQPQVSPLQITTTKVCTQLLALDEEVIHATPSAGHLSSSSIYPACFAPYLICTACADGSIRFWHCKVEENQYSWIQWTMMMNDRESSIEVPGQPLCVSSAFSGRMACAYKHGRSFTRSALDHTQEEGRYVNISISIFECESTGGSEWVLEDTIPLKNVALPSQDTSCGMARDLGSLYDASIRNKRAVEALVTHLSSPHTPEGPLDHQVVFQRLLSVPSYTTLHSLRKAVVERGNQSLLTPHKSLVQLDWVSTEDGSHVLTVSVGSRILLFTPVSTDIAQSNVQALKAPKSVSRVLLKQASSMGPPPMQPEEMRWMCLRTTNLSTADSLPALPMQLSWVRDGILVIGLDSEMQIYSQWRAVSTGSSPAGSGDQAQQTGTGLASGPDHRSLREEEILSRAQESSQLRLPSAGAPSSGNISRNTSSSLISAALVSGSDRPQTDSKDRSGSHSMENAETLPDFGLFEASRLACPVLPQYHPKQLMELLEFGKIRRVKAILGHLLRCLAGLDNFQKSYEHFLEMSKEGATDGIEDASKGEGEGSRSWSRSRALSLAAASPGLQPSPLGDSLTCGPVFPEEVQLDYVEITSIPPLPLFTLLSCDHPDVVGSVSSTAPSKNAAEKDYSGLFDMGSSTAFEDDLDPGQGNTSQQTTQEPLSSSLTTFGPRQVRLLSKLLTHTHLPGLSSLDQMHLLALADTVASTDRNQFGYTNTGIEGGEQLQVSIDSLDECGLRFLLSMRHHSYLLCCLPLVQRAQLQRTGLSSHSLVWAFHSETQEELLQLVPSIQKGNPKWADLKEVGIGWWMRSNTLLRTTMEKVAKAAFQAHNEPLDAALFYLAMKKKNLVWGLFRSVRDTKMTTFFQNNFLEDRWRKAALKNAFALLGKQRFEHAAAFFLLAGALKDAVDVCLHKLDDLQLAMVLIRLYEGEMESCPPQLRRLLHQEILAGPHPDPFLRSMALWWLQDYKGALTTLLHKRKRSTTPTMPRITTSEGKNLDAQLSNKGVHANPSVFNFYLYLRTHPLVVRSSLVQQQQQQGSLIRGGPQLPRLGKTSLHSPAKNVSTTAESWLRGCEDTITPLERRLYFMTAHAHFQAGCPALALEVLCRLPDKIAIESSSPASWNTNSPLSPLNESTQEDFDWNQSVGTHKSDTMDWSQPMGVQKTESVDWSQPSGGQKAESFDWSQPLGSQKAESFDWSQPVGKDVDASWNKPSKKPFDWNETLTGHSSDEDDGIQMNAPDPKQTASPEKEKGPQSVISPDVMAQQLKFIACLKIMMEELSTLATGFEVDGGQLRYHLYTWLERSVTSLSHLCETHPHGTDAVHQSIGDEVEGEDAVFDSGVNEPPTLHEILAADRLDFEAKLSRAARRRHWLRANETLLRTLLSYCSLHGAHGGGLAAVRMELMLLLQELQQEERSQHQLLSPLPFPTTLPLLAASVASQKTVVTDPIRFLQSCSHDILQTVKGLVSPPGVSSLSSNTVSILRDLGTALSACIYQSLCDSDNFVVKQNKVSNLEEFISSSVVHQNSHLLAGHRSQKQQMYSTQEEGLQPTTAPNKWPGVQSLRALVARDKDEDSPKLHTLLCEAFVAVYFSQLAFALATFDCHLLYRLAKGQFKERHWSSLFGGGTKRLLRVSTVTPPTNAPGSVATPPNSPLLAPNADNTDAAASSNEGSLFTTLSRQRLKLHWRLLGQGGTSPLPASNIKEDRPTYREQFLPPEMSMVSWFMAKPQLPTEWDIDYDSNQSLASSDEEEEIEDEDGNVKRPDRSSLLLEQLEPGSFSWSLMRLALVKLCKGYILSFLDVAGIELQDLPVTSPWIHSSLRVIQNWMDQVQQILDAHGRPPTNFLPNLVLHQEQSSNQYNPTQKYKALMETHNTPFKSHHPLAVSARRLWNYLVRQESIQDIFIRYIFSRKHPHLQYAEEPSEPAEMESCPVRIIHKDQDSILSFCLSKSGSGNEMLALCTLKEIQELDVALLMKEDSSWMEDEAEYDILNMNKSVDLLQASDYIVVQHPVDRHTSNPGGGSNLFNSPTQPNASMPGSGAQTGRQTTVIKGYPGGINPQFYQFVLERSRHLLKPLKKHKVDGIRRMCAHPYLPLYLTGSQDGSVKMWEWGHQQPVSVPRPAGTFAKVTRVLFNTQGNKFGVTDGDGNVSLWQVGLASMSTAPFFSVQCHSKHAGDFDFVQSSSLLATAGQSSDNRNVSLWDTLLPQRKANVASFQCHEHGSSAIAFAARSQVLISAGKKGDICIFDVRQRQLRHTFQAHDHPIKCLALDPGEEFYITGSADGDIKVWGLNYHVLLHSFLGEHSRSTLFRNIGMGVSQLYVDRAGHLLSCGADGSLKWRQLPERDLVVKTLF